VQLEGDGRGRRGKKEEGQRGGTSAFHRSDI